MKIRIIVILQILCILFILVGLYLQWSRDANLAFPLLTLGGLIFGFSEKIDKYRVRRDCDSL